MDIKTLRKERGFPQKLVAQNIGVKQATYCNIENGRKNPSILVAKRLADFFGISMDDLFSLLRDGGEKGGADDGQKQ